MKTLLEIFCPDFKENPAMDEQTLNALLAELRRRALEADEAFWAAKARVGGTRNTRETKSLALAKYGWKQAELHVRMVMIEAQLPITVTD